MKTLQTELGARPVVREAQFSDYESIAALQKRNGLATKSCEDWIALWRENPVYRSLGGRWSIGWTLETAAGEIVGFIACIPVAYRFRGREILAAVTGSWVTDPFYRGYSFAVLNAVARQTEIELLLTNTASPKAEPCMQLLRWSKLPVPGWDKSFFWITNYRGFAESILRIYSIPAASALAYVLGPVLYCRNTARTIGCWRSQSALEVEPCSEIDTRFDDFWEQLVRVKHDTLLGVRDRKTLEWHFKRPIEQGRAWILRILDGSEMIAYAVLDRIENPEVGLKRARLVDFQSIRDPREPLAAALSWILRKCRTDRVHALETSGAVLENLGEPEAVAPCQRNLNAWRYYYKVLNPSLAEALSRPETWCTSHYDGDASL